MIPPGKINEKMIDRLPWVWIGYLLLPSPHRFHQVSRFCSLSLSLTRWRCWFVLASWLPGFLTRWSPCGQLLDCQTPSPYSSLWCQPSWQNQQQCTTPSFTRSSITNLPVAKLVVWKPLRRNLWKTSGKFQKLEMNDTFFVSESRGVQGTRTCCLLRIRAQIT